MYFRRGVTLLLLILGALAASAQSISIVPVATAQVRDRLYTTTLAFRNDGRQDAVCDVFYALPNDPKGGALRGRYTLPAGGAPQIELNAFSEASAIGSLQIRCSTAVVIAARIQVSTDGGATFDEGRTYAAVDEASGFRGSRTVAVDRDLFVAEVLGKPATFEAVVMSKSGSEVGRESYTVKAFAQKTLDLSDLRSAPTAERPASVTVRVTTGDGAVVAGKETRDRDLLQLVAGRDRQFALSSNAVRNAVDAASPSHIPPPRLGTASFQAAPFQDSFTGLVYFRNRWYDPRTGSWLTPDPMGYQDSANPYAFAAGDPVNRRDPTGLCLGLDKEGRPCSEYAGMLTGFLADTFGFNDLPKTGSTKIDQTIRNVAQAPLRAATVPATTLLATGESTGELAYRMERSTFNGEPALAATVDDALLVAGSLGDLATVTAPLALLKGAPELTGSRASQRGSIVVRGRKTHQADEVVTWLDEGGDLRSGASPGMRFDAYNHQSSAPGARSNVLTGRGQAPYLEFIDPAGNVIGAKFDGVRGFELIDRKLNPFFSAKAIDQATRQVAVARHYGLKVVWELPTQQAVEAANRFLSTNNIRGITLRVAP
jgi:RHS repeat-associated protein